MAQTVIGVRVAMSNAKIERKIAVIFATDVVGYSCPSSEFLVPKLV